MMTKNNSIAHRLNCASTQIPEAYEKLAAALSKSYIAKNSLSGLYRMDSNIVYNRVCNLVNKQLTTNPEFCVKNFADHINFTTLFYSPEDIRTLAQIYKESPSESFPYVICFFSRKLHSFRHHKAPYIKNLDMEDVDEVMMIALYKTLERFDPQYDFSFAYLELELFAAITQLGGDMFTFRLPRNDYVNFLKFSYFIEKYKLTLDNIKQFLYEINLSEEEAAGTELTFHIRKQDYEYACNITLKKARSYFLLYTIEDAGLISCMTYDKEADMVLDNVGSVIDSGYTDVEMRIYAEQTFADTKEQRIFHRLSEPEGSVFTNRELAEDYEYTRYALSKMKDKLKKDFT